MYVCMYMCVYVCTYVCRYVGRYVGMYVFMCVCFQMKLSIKFIFCFIAQDMKYFADHSLLDNLNYLINPLDNNITLCHAFTLDNKSSIHCTAKYIINCSLLRKT